MADTIIINESTSTEIKPNFFKKLIPSTKTIVITIGAAALVAAGAIVFALSRSDEDDFEIEQAKFDAEDSAI